MALEYKSHLLQNADEFQIFLTLLRQEKVSSYLEIGCMYGGSLWRIARSLPSGSRIVGVDLMCDTPAAQDSLESCVRELKELGYDAHLIIGDSKAPDVIEQVRALGPYDCVLIDGDHSLLGVTSDWENYGPMGRIVALHDISWNSTWKSSVPGRITKPILAPELWAQLKQQYRSRAIQLHRPNNYYGIGVLWTH